MDGNFVIRGDIFFTPEKNKCEMHPDSYLVVKDSRIVCVEKTLSKKYSSLEKHDCSGKLVIPALSDLHVHASQFAFRGLWMDEELLEWLNSHTFPEEEKFADISYARKAYGIFTRQLVRSPSAHACIFATIHKDSTLLLCRMLEEAGLPCYVGKVNMDRNSTPGLSEKTEDSIRETEEYINEVLPSFSLVKPVVTPRFIPSCSDELCRALGELAVKYDLPVQSHLSENLSEVDWVKELCPDSTSYAASYKERGLWGRTKTVMAHCVHSLSREEELLKDENLFIAHCPDSNTNLVSGIMPARFFLDNGYNIGLGSDIAGGVSISLFDAITDAVRVSKLYHRHVDERFAPLTFKEAFFIASKLGGSFFSKTGSFESGYDADILVLDDSSLETPLEGLTVAERVERYVYLNPKGAPEHKICQGKWLF